MPQAPDTALRRLVVDLAAMHAEDVSDILAQLSEEQRERVQILLREFTGLHPQSLLLQTKRAELRQDVSPWLLRLAEAPVRPRNMTDAAWAALKRAASGVGDGATVQLPDRSLGAAIGRAP